MIQIPLVKSHEAFVRKTPETTKAQVCQKFFDMKINEVLFFYLSKTRILRKMLKNIGLFDPESRKGSGLPKKF